MHCQTRYGFTDLKDASVPKPNQIVTGVDIESNWSNSMDSSDVSQIMKYVWLILGRYDEIGLSEWVFTSRGHTLRVFGED